MSWIRVRAGKRRPACRLWASAVVMFVGACVPGDERSPGDNPFEEVVLSFFERPGGADDSENEPAPSDMSDDPFSATVLVETSRVLRRIPESLYGTNIEWTYHGNGLWDADGQQLNPELTDLVERLGPSLLRFPGGIFSDYYHWQDGIGPQQDRPTTPHYVGGPSSRHTFGTDEALALAVRVGGQLLITVNAGTGTAQEAADWVAYVNHRTQNTSPVTYWEIGNELYDQSPNPAAESVATPPEIYVERVVEFASAMRAVDPSIRIGAIACEGIHPYMEAVCGDWTEQVLTHCGDLIDFLAVHNAYSPLVVGDEEHDVRTVYAAMLASPLLIEESLIKAADQIARHAPARSDRIRIAVTEWGPWFHADPGSRWVDHVKTLGSALFVADTLRVFIDSTHTDIANGFKLVDNAFMGWIGLRDGQYAYKAPSLAMRMYTRHFGEVLVSSTTAGPTYDSLPVGIVDGVSRVPYLEVVSSLSEDGRTLYVLAINKHFESPISAKIELVDFEPEAEGTAWTLTGTGIDANTGTDLPEMPGLNWAQQVEDTYNPRFREGGPDEVTLTASTVSGLGPTFAYTFGPHSVTSLEIRSSAD